MECALRSGVGVTVLWEWRWSGNGVCHRSGIGVRRKMQINTAMPLQSGNGVVRMEWQWSVHFIATPADFGSGTGVVICGDKESINAKTKPRNVYLAV